MAAPFGQSRLVAFIDEAGDSGNKIGQGSSHFLAMGAVVFLRDRTPDILATFDEARIEREHNKQFKKFSANSDKDNYVLTKILGGKSITTAKIGFHKPPMAGTFVRANPKEEYQYLVKFTVERISWIARDIAQQLGDTNLCCEITFSEQKMYPYDDLATYLDRLRAAKDGYNCSAEWTFIHPNFSIQKHTDEQPIHLADICASAFHRAIDPKSHGMTDDRFLRNIFPAIYRKNGRQYGLKIFPSSSLHALRQAGNLSFLDSLK